MSESYHLAQVNIARAIAPLEDPVMSGFVDQLDHINALADKSPGFVWRLQTEEGGATSIQVYPDERIIVNLSVWDSLESLKDFVYSGEHLEILKQKKSWFEKMSVPTLALWWVPAGHKPTEEEAKKALDTLAEQGPGQEVFTFSKPVALPGS